MAYVVMPMRDEFATLGDLLDLLRASDRGTLTLVRDGTSVVLPESVVKVLARAATVLAPGRGVELAAVDRELTPRQVADLLDIPRSRVLELVDSGELVSLPGTPRLIPLDQVLAYQEQLGRERREALDQMTVEAQEMGGYDTPTPVDDSPAG